MAWYQEILLESLSNADIVRELIAFLIVVVTVGIALILVLSTVISDDAANRFDRSKQVLTAMIEILGTVVVFILLREHQKLLSKGQSIK